MTARYRLERRNAGPRARWVLHAPPGRLVRLLKRTLTVTEDRDRAEASRFTWGTNPDPQAPGYEPYDLTVLGVLNGLVGLALIVDGRCEHRWKVAREAVDYSPRSFRWCSSCGQVDILRGSGWAPYMRLTEAPSWLA